VDDLKLTAVRRVAARTGVVVLLFGVAGYLLQAGDSQPTPSVSGDYRAVQLTPEWAPDEGRSYVVSYDSVVPVGSRAIEVPILMYHYIRTPPSPRGDPLGYRLSVSPEVFQTQM